MEGGASQPETEGTPLGPRPSAAAGRLPAGWPQEGGSGPATAWRPGRSTQPCRRCAGDRNHQTEVDGSWVFISLWASGRRSRRRRGPRGQGDRGGGDGRRSMQAVFGFPGDLRTACPRAASVRRRGARVSGRDRDPLSRSRRVMPGNESRPMRRSRAAIIASPGVMTGFRRLSSRGHRARTETGQGIPGARSAAEGHVVGGDGSGLPTEIIAQIGVDFKRVWHTE